MANKTDKLNFAVYALHGDMCGHQVDGQCASHHKRSDYVLVAAFAYFTEAIDYAQEINRRGVNARIRKPQYGRGFDWSNYSLATVESTSTK